MHGVHHALLRQQQPQSSSPMDMVCATRKRKRHWKTRAQDYIKLSRLPLEGLNRLDSVARMNAAPTDSIISIATETNINFRSK